VRAPLERAGVPSNVRLHHASEAVEMDDSPSAFRRKKGSSLQVGFQLVRDREASA
jgi:phosphate acyltransferase